MDKTIIEGNKLIAEFMGVSHAAVDGNLYYYVNGDSYDTLEYHTSWDWLIPVVEKIELLGYVVIIQQRSCYIQSHDTRSVLSTAQFFDSKIQTVWTAVISFIQWYNSQSKTNNNEK